MYRLKKKSFKFSTITIALILLFSIVFGVVVVAAEPAFDVGFKLENVVDKDNAELMQEFIATFTITPKPIPVAKAEKKAKEIYLVMDTSGSMGYYLNGRTRLSVAQESARNFLNNLKDESNVKVGLIRYDNVATVHQKLTNNFSEVRSAINSLFANGGTNLGDGLRIAYHELDKGSNDADKYVILLTDGEPTFHSYASGYYEYSGWGYWRTQTWITTEYIMGSGSAGANYTGGGNISTFNDTDYCHKIISELYNTSVPRINSYMVAFSPGSNADFMDELATAAGGVYKGANSAVDLDNVYKDIAEDIIQQFTIKNGVFEDKLPSKLSILGVDGVEDYEILGQKIKIELPIIEYKLNGAKTEYTADPIVFSIRLKGNAVGNYTIGLDEAGNKTSKFSYEDLDGTTKVEYFDPISGNIVPFDAPKVKLESKRKVGEKMEAKINIYEIPAGTAIVNIYRIKDDGTRDSIDSFVPTSTNKISSLPDFSMYENYTIEVEAVSPHDATLRGVSNPLLVHKKININ